MGYGLWVMGYGLWVKVRSDFWAICCRYRGGLEYDQNAHDQTLILAQLLVQLLVQVSDDDIKWTTGYG